MRNTVVLSALCLALSSPARAQEVTSKYTELAKCPRDPAHPDDAPEGSDAPIYCLGAGDYGVSESYGPYDIHRSIYATGDSGYSVELRPKADCPVARYGDKLEWRLTGGKPFAVIQRVTCFALDEEKLMPGKRLSEYLVVKGLKGFESIDGEVSTRTKGANEKARAIADAGLQKR